VRHLILGVLGHALKSNGSAGISMGRVPHLGRGSGTGGDAPASIQNAPRMLVFLTGPAYLRVMQLPLLRGRFFTAEDNTKSSPVIVIDSVFAHTYFHGGNPVGQTITFDPIN
jgi:hypothetical protein